MFWVDERVVPISHQDSNYNSAKVSLPLFHDYLCVFPVSRSVKTGHLCLVLGM